MHNIKSRWHFFSGVICFFFFFFGNDHWENGSQIYGKIAVLSFLNIRLSTYILWAFWEISVLFWILCYIILFLQKEILFFVFSHKHSRCVYWVKQAHVLSIYFVMNDNVSWDVLFYTLLYTFAFIHLTLQCIQCVCSLGIKSMTLLVPQSTSWAAGRNAADWGLT